VNCRELQFSGDKFKDKKYHWHTGYPGGLVERNPRHFLTNVQKPKPKTNKFISFIHQAPDSLYDEAEGKTPKEVEEAKVDMSVRPEVVLFRAVHGMLPKTKHRKTLVRKFLHLFPGPVHTLPHDLVFQRATGSGRKGPGSRRKRRNGQGRKEEADEATVLAEFKDYAELNLLHEDRGILQRHVGKLKRVKGKRKFQLRPNPEN
jgi:ribosomal protein L13